MESQRSEDVRAQFVAVLAIFVDVLAQSTGALWYAAAPAVYATAATSAQSTGALSNAQPHPRSARPQLVRL